MYPKGCIDRWEKISHMILGRSKVSFFLNKIKQFMEIFYKRVCVVVQIKILFLLVTGGVYATLQICCRPCEEEERKRC